MEFLEQANVAPQCEALLEFHKFNPAENRGTWNSSTQSHENDSAGNFATLV